MVSVASVFQKLLSTVDVQHRNQGCRKGAFFFTRGAEFGSDLYTTNRTSGSKVQLDLQTQTPQIHSDQLPKHWGMLGSTKRGGEFRQHQTY